MVGITCLEYYAPLVSSESSIALVERSSVLCCFLQTALESFSCAFVLRISSNQLEFSFVFLPLLFTVVFVKSSVAARVSA